MNNTCSTCNETKPSDQFYKPTKCKTCHSKYISDYLKSRPEKTAKNREYVKKSRPRRKNARKTLVQNLKTNPCTDCGRRFHPEVMDFDHVGDGPKGGVKKSIAQMTAMASSVDKILQEIAKCELVCANCHRIRTIRRRIGEEAYLSEIPYQ